MIPEYIFKRSEANSIPVLLLPFIKQKNIESSDIKLCIPLDMNPNGNMCDSYILCTSEKIITLSGIVSSTMEKHKKNVRKFILTDESELDLSDYTSFDIASEVSSLTLIGISENDGGKLIARASLTRRYELESAQLYLKMLRETGDIKLMIDSSEDSLYCPKCKTRYSDPASKICFECMDRKKIMQRVWELMIKYKGMMLTLMLTLLVTGALGIATPLISSVFMYDKVIGDPENQFYGMIGLAVGMLILVKVLSTVISAIHSIVSSVIAAKMVYDLKKTIFSSIQRLSVGFFTSRKTGGLMTQVSGDANTIYWFFCDGMPGVLYNVSQMIAVTIIMFVMNPLLALVSLITFPIAFVAVSSLRGRMKVFHRRRFSRESSMNGLLSGVLSGIRVVKAFAKEDDEIERFNKKSVDCASAEKDASDYSATHSPYVNFLLGFSSILVWGVGGVMIMKGYGNLTYGVLSAFVACMNMVYSPMFQLVGMLSQATDSMNAMGRLVEIMDALPDVKESDNPIHIDNFEGSIEFRNVSFGYDVAKNVINNVSFKVEAGHSLGIVGHTGMGKSTIANLIIRLYDTGEGGVYLDNVNVRDISLKQLHENTAIVSQETYIFIGTVYENIAYATPDAKPEDVIYAAKIAGAHEFISRMSEGYETMIGMGYGDLSGGEKQRISIARALLKNPKILILDEATAAMDTQTERNIQEALERLKKGRTTVMIAHRLSTLRDVDSLIVVEDGKIIEEGTHSKLIREKGIYYDLYRLQLEAMKNIGVEE